MPLPGADEVHVWAFDLSRSPGEVGGVLPAGDLRRAESIAGRERRSHWVVARAGLRSLLGGYLGEDPAALRFPEAGKPRLEPPSPLRFNLSHSGDVALVAVAREREVGVDVEAVDRGRDVAALARRMLLGSEQSAVAESGDAPLAFYRHWVAKEAFVKATGRGLESMRSFELSLDGPEGPRLVQVGGDRAEGARWTLRMLDVAAPYVAALVFEGEARVAPLALFEP